MKIVNKFFYSLFFVLILFMNVTMAADRQPQEVPLIDQAGDRAPSPQVMDDDEITLANVCKEVCMCCEGALQCCKVAANCCCQNSKIAAINCSLAILDAECCCCSVIQHRVNLIEPDDQFMD
ncbi:MAG: hypothetical protein K0R14_2129 [Burkholderiales bacterium]|jgi:hypothetical protein|nr:hypothetical protein [Burkholderiales bacterium]